MYLLLSVYQCELIINAGRDACNSICFKNETVCGVFCVFLLTISCFDAIT